MSSDTDRAALTAARVKAWHNAHPERVKEIKRKYREAHRQQSRDAEHARYMANLDASRSRARTRTKKWYLLNKKEVRARINERQRNQYKTKKLDGGFMERKREHARSYRTNNRDKLNAHAALRRARKRLAADESANLAVITSFYAIARRVSECTGIPHDVDHITPIAKGGRHHERNLQVLPSVINGRKGARIIAA